MFGFSNPYLDADQKLSAGWFGINGTLRKKMGVFISVDLFYQNFHVTLWESDLFYLQFPLKSNIKGLSQLIVYLANVF